MCMHTCVDMHMHMCMCIACVCMHQVGDDWELHGEMVEVRRMPRLELTLTLPLTLFWP